VSGGERDGGVGRPGGGEQRVVFVSGLSGSGKTTAMAALEDLAFYCADNLPVQLVDQFLDLCRKATPPIEKVALAIDAREAPFLRAVPEVVSGLRDSGTRVEVIFLECSNAVLLDRYRETRRVHPLAPEGKVEEGIERERRLLEHVAALADTVIDTTDLNVHALRARVVQHVSGESRPTVVNLVSFGFRYGTPPGLELQFDVRFLPNPFFEEQLRAGSGRDRAVAEYVLKSPGGAVLLERIRDVLDLLLPAYDAEGKAYLTIGIGCTGGRHRSVAIAEALAEGLRGGEREVNLAHRDVERGS
jgi:UPF0042 nucleotide-binding protein